MQRRTQKTLSLALVASFASFSLVGCNTLPTVSSDSANALKAASTQTGSELASGFATAARQQGLSVQVAGAVVTVSQADGTSVRYDFTLTPSTGHVAFSTPEGLKASIAYTSPDARISPISLALMAVRMVYGGVKAWYWYTHSHTGTDYNQDDLVKAILYGILEQGLASMPVGFLLKRLAPIVWKWITGEAPIAPSLAALWERAKGDVDAVTQVLKDGMDSQRAPQP